MTYTKEGEWYVFRNQSYAGSKYQWCGETFREYHSWDFWQGTFYIKHERDATMFTLRWS